MINVRAHKKAVRTDSDATLGAKERQGLTLVQLAFTRANQFHRHYYMCLEHSPVLRMACLKASFAVFNDASHALHQSWFLFANVTLQLALGRECFLATDTLILLCVLQFLDHILEGQVQGQTVDPSS